MPKSGVIRRICHVAGKLAYGYLAVAALTIAYLSLAESDGIDAVLAFLPVLTATGVLLACLMIVCRCAFTGSANAELSRRTPMWAAALVLVTSACFFYTYRATKLEVDMLRASVGLRDALICYVREHVGKLPAGFGELVEDGCLREVSDGTYVVTYKPNKEGFRIESPEWFDVAWNGDIRGVDANGYVVGSGRQLIIPGKNAPEGLDSCCELVSWSFAALLGDMRHGTATQPAS